MINQEPEMNAQTATTVHHRFDIEMPEHLNPQVNAQRERIWTDMVEYVTGHTDDAQKAALEAHPGAKVVDVYVWPPVSHMIPRQTPLRDDEVPEEAFMLEQVIVKTKFRQWTGRLTVTLTMEQEREAPRKGDPRETDPRWRRD